MIEQIFLPRIHPECDIPAPMPFSILASPMHQSKRVPRMNVDKGPVVDRGRKLHKVEIVNFCCLGMVKPDEVN